MGSPFLNFNASSKSTMLKKYSPKILDYFKEEDYAFIVMEYISWPTLWNMLFEIYPEEKCWYEYESSLKWIFLDLLRAMQFLFENQISHQDLKPENIMVNPKVFEFEELSITQRNQIFESEGIVKIIDFGFSDYYIKNQEYSCNDKGTKEYCSPEKLNESYGNYSWKCSEVYSLGVILYVLICHVFPVFKKEGKITTLTFPVFEGIFCFIFSLFLFFIIKLSKTSVFY